MALKQVNTLVSAMNLRTRPCFYCSEHGVVYLPDTRPSHIPQSEWQQLMEIATSEPTRSELEKMRGSQCDGGNYTTLENSSLETGDSAHSPDHRADDDDLERVENGQQRGEEDSSMADQEDVDGTTSNQIAEPRIMVEETEQPRIMVEETEQPRIMEEENEA